MRGGHHTDGQSYPISSIGTRSCSLQSMPYSKLGIFLLDIMDGYGHSLLDQVLAPPVAIPQSLWHWPQASTTAADWMIWCTTLPRIMATTALGSWTHQPHLLVFVPYNQCSHTAYFASQHHFWTTYGPHQQGPAHKNQTLFPSGISLMLPLNLSYFRIHH